jgi:hypothetical protein
MTVICDQSGLRMWMDGFSPIVFLSVDAKLSESDRTVSRCVSKTLHQVIKKCDTLYAVIDLTAVTGHSSAAILEACFAKFPELFTEIKYLALVSDPSFAVGLKKHLHTVSFPQPEMQYDTFANFYSALNKINTLRQQRMGILYA